MAGEQNAMTTPTTTGPTIQISSWATDSSA